MSGIAFLRRLLMKQAMKKSKDASGIMSLNKNLVNDVEINVKSWVDSAKRQGADIDKMSEETIKYMVEINKPKPIRAIPSHSTEGQKITNDLFNMLDRQSGKNVIKTDFGGGMTDIVTETIIKIKTMKPIDAMKEANSVIARKGKYKNLTKEQSQKILKDTNDHIFQRDVPIDPEDFAQGGRSGTGLNYLLGEDDQNMRVPYGAGSTQSDFDRYLREREQRDREEQKRKFKKDFEDWKKWQDTEGGTVDWAAEGGRIGFGLGGFNAARRAFLKWLGAGAAGVGVAKSGLLSILKGGGKKQVVKELTQVPIKSGVDGMPVWFKPLVNKIIKTGDEVESGAERVIVHSSELPGSKTKLYVTQELDTGNVMVDIGQGKHGFPAGHHGQPVRLEYKAAEDIMTGPDMDDMHKVGVRDPHVKTKVRDEMTFEKTKHQKKPEEFWVEEAEFTGGHPENIKFEETTFEKFGSHGSDFDEVEKFARGKVKKVKPTKKKLQTEHESGKWEADYDDSLPDYEDFSSGGRVPLRGGYLAGGARSLGKKYKGSTLAAILENPKLLGAELGHDGIMELMNFLPGLFSTGGRVPFSDGNGVYDEKAALGKRVRELMDEGYEFGEAVKQAMKEGYAEGGRVPSVGGLAGMLGE